MNTPAKTTAPVRKPAPKIAGQGHFGIKALIISLSLIGTMGGWGALAVGQIKDAQAKQIEDARANQEAYLAMNEPVATNAIIPQSRMTAHVPVAPRNTINAPAIKTAPAPSNAVRASSRPVAPIIIAANDVPARVSAPTSATSTPVLRDIPVRPRVVARSRSSR